MSTFFKRGEDVFVYDLSNAGQCMGALALLAPALHADHLAKAEALKAWELAKARHDQELQRLTSELANAKDGDVARIEAQIDALQDPGQQPPAPPDVTAEYVLANIDAGWELLDGPPEPPPPTAEELARVAKITGIEFEGVMCSATKEDQAGLLAVLIAFQMQGASFQPTRFDFSNGNKLVLTKNNIQQFIAVWMPFRNSFFEPVQ